MWEKFLTNTRSNPDNIIELLCPFKIELFPPKPISHKKAGFPMANFC